MGYNTEEESDILVVEEEGGGEKGTPEIWDEGRMVWEEDGSTKSEANSLVVGREELD